jgi:tRNA(Arg) A34 adenosine deaminase TadA
MIEDRDEDEVRITVPGWVNEVASAAGPLADVDQAMDLVIELSRLNVERGGGPFAAAVLVGSRLVAAGVNRVLESGLSIAHAEIVALARAQRRLGPNLTRATLVASTEPCCQCFGALVWSGVTALVCGATTADAEAIGFDEGPKPEAWPALLEARGIRVTQQIRRVRARAVLDAYAHRGGRIYGPGGEHS